MSKAYGAPSEPGQSVIVIDAAAADDVLLPHGFSLFRAEFVRAGPDLMVIDPDGGELLLRGFFTEATPPRLNDGNGGQLSGELAATLAGPLAPGELAQAAPGPGALAIGRVDTLDGTVTVTHVDGTQGELEVGDPLYQGDVLQTAADSAVGIVFADETALSMAEGSRIVIDELVYDPGTQDGEISFSIVEGVFVFVSGAIAKTDPDAMVIETPVASIGIRGTAGGINHNAAGTAVVLLKEPVTGEIVVSTGTDTKVLNVANQEIVVTAADRTVAVQGSLSPEQIAQSYGDALRFISAKSDVEMYGVERVGADHSAIDQALQFETAAGGETGFSVDHLPVTTGEDASDVQTADPLQAIALVDEQDLTDGTQTGGSGRHETLTQPVQETAAAAAPSNQPVSFRQLPFDQAVGSSDGWSTGINWSVAVPADVENASDLYRVVSTHQERDGSQRTFEAPQPPEMLAMAAGAIHPSGSTPGAAADQLESALGVSLGSVGGARTPVDGAAISATVNLPAGKTLWMDVLFDPFDTEANGDFAFFAGGGQPYLIADVAATPAGASGWLTIAFDGGGSALPVGIGVINDGSDQFDPVLLVDNVHIADGALPDPAALSVGATFAAEGIDYQIKDVQPGTFLLLAQRPLAADDAAATGEDGPITVDVLANDGAIGETAPQLSITGLDDSSTAGRLSLAGDGRSVVYDPNGRFEALAAGETQADGFVYTVRNDLTGAVDTAAVAITVIGVNDAPTARDDHVNLGEDQIYDSAAQPLIPGLLVNDTDPDATDVLTVAAVDGSAGNVGTPITLASGALLTVQANGDFIYAPASEFNGGDGFTYTIADPSGATSTAAVAITVAAVNDPPVAAPASLSTPEDTPGAGTLAATDADGDPLTFSLGTAPANGIAIVAPDGAFTYAPAPDFAGTDSFSYRVSDPGGASSVAAVDITVSPVNDAPLAANDTAAGDENALLSIDVLANDSDVDADDGPGNFSLLGASIDTVTGLSAPLSTARVDVAGNRLLFDPGTDFDQLAEGATATVEASYAMADDSGASSSAAVTITVTGSNDAPVAADDIAVTDEFSSVRIAPERLLFNDRDVDTGDVLSIVGLDDSLTEGEVALNADGSITYDPSGLFSKLGFGETAVTTFDYILADAAGASARATVTVTVEGRINAPTADGELLASFEESAQGQLPPGWDASRLPPEWVRAGDIAVADQPLAPGNSAAIPAPDGSHMAVLSASGAPVAPTGAPTGGLGVAEVLGVPAADLLAVTHDTDGTDAKDGAAMSTEVLVSPNSRIWFDWTFVSSDFAGPNGEAKNDVAVVSISGGGADQVFRLADVRQVLEFTGDAQGAFGPLSSFIEYEGAQAAPITLGFAVLNDANQSNDSTLIVDNIRLDPAVDLGRFELVDTQQGGVLQTFAERPLPGDDALAADEDGAAATTLAALLGNDQPPRGGGSLRIGEVAGLSASGGQTVLASGALLAVLADGTVRYDPNGAFEHLGQGESAADSFTYTALAGNGAAATATVSVTVSGANDVPLASDDAAAIAPFRADQTLNITPDLLLANDWDPDLSDNLSIAAVDGRAAIGAVTLNADGSISYDPSGRFDYLGGGEQASDSFLYTVADGHGGAASARVTLTINGANDDPLAVNDAVTTSEDAPIVVDVLANDSDPDQSDRLQVVSVDRGDSEGTAGLDADGNVTYDPGEAFQWLPEGESASDNFSYVIEDGRGGSASGEVQVTVTGLNDVPIAADAGFGTDELTPLVLSIDGFEASDPDRGDVLHFAGVDAGATLGSVALTADGLIVYSPNGAFDALRQGETAVDSFEYTVADAHGATDSATAFVTIGGLGTPRFVEGFEAGLDQWHSIGAAGTVGAYQEDGGAHHLFTPAEGDAMAALDADGPAARLVADFLDFEDELALLDVIDGSVAAAGSAMSRTIDVQRGDILSFHWGFDNADLVTAGGPGLNDFALFVADDTPFRIADGREQFAATGQHAGALEGIATWQAPADGTVDIGFGVFDDDDAVGGGVRSSTLLIDAIEINGAVPEPGEGYTLARSEADGAFQTWVQSEPS